nr:methyltransferase [Rhodococcus sp. HNM0569]
MRRRPDVEAPNLHAVDATDRLLLDEAADALAADPAAVVVLGDRYGALTLGAAVSAGATGIRTFQDALTGERALASNARRVGLADRYRSLPLGVELLAGARVVLVQLPRGLAELDEYAQAIAAHADPSVRVYAGGRIKHLSTSMNDVLARSFSHVHATLARQKSRVLVASGPVPEPARFPLREHSAELGLTVVAHGAAFGGAGLDIGTRALVGVLGDTPADARTALDLGCGTGILAAALARLRPELEVIATDQSAGAVASAAETAAANGLADRIRVVRDDAAGSLDDDSVDLVVCNPPFHVGAAVHTGSADKMFRAAGRVLRRGGEMWTVFNTHLAYTRALERAVGPTRTVTRTRKFTVTASVAR